ncbi:MAG TPA: pyrrolo-quinoline quinone, partial [Burkholderiaceae bacterium]
VIVGVTPSGATVSTIQTQAFTATVVNAANAAVTWRVDGIAGGNASVGTISTTGLYTPSQRVASHAITATSVQDPSKSGNAAVTVQLMRGVLTHHNDNMRSGLNPLEAVLTPGNVTTATFGKLGVLPVDGPVYAQPLYAVNVPIAGQLRDLVIVATEHNSVYAFDASGASSTPLWHTNFNDPANGKTPVPALDTQCADIVPEIGITSTPVVDPATGTVYVVAMTKEDGAYAHRIHALDITTGGPRLGAGTLIKAVAPGTAVPNDGTGRVVFSSLRENQRAALLLSHGALYVSFGSFCDLGDHHGWLLAYDAETLKQLGAFSATPNGTEGGIWRHAAADAGGSVYVVTGDGTFDAPSGGNNYGNTFLKFMDTTLPVSDYFTPFNQSTLEAVNADLGAGGALLLPDQASAPVHLMVGAGKQGIVYLLDRDGMGAFQVGRDSQIVQSFPVGTCGAGACAVFSAPAYFNNTVYFAAASDSLRAFALKEGQLTLSHKSMSTLRWPGATPVVSANGVTNGIVWMLETNGSGAPAVLRAHAAADVSVELYTSNQNALRDSPGRAIKHSVPTVFNGRVYVGTQDQVSVYGLLP